MGRAFLSAVAVAVGPLSIFGGAKAASVNSNGSTIFRDVAIIGGGATGTHASIALGDAGLSTVIIERSSKLGGPSQTYIEPDTGIPIDYGVQRFQNTPSTLDFFQRVGVEAAADFLPDAFNQTVYLDFTSGRFLDGFDPSLDWASYAVPLEQYPYLTWGKRLPDPVPSDLYMPFGQYIEKYSLQDIAYSLNSIWGGVDELTVPTLNVIAGTGLVEIANQEVGGSFRVVGGNEQPYLNALQYIRKEDILFNSTVAAASRNARGIRLLARDGSGRNTTVIAKQLLVTIPTLGDNMAPFDLDARERGLFDTFSAVGFWIAVFRVPGLVPNVTYAHATTYRPYNMSAEFGVFRLLPTPVKDLYTGFFNGDYSMTDEEAVAMAVKSLTSVVQAVTGAAVPPDQLPSLVEWKRVTPWRPVMTADAIKNRTWDKMYALQGHRSTWYNSMLFTPGGPQLWNYTETVLLPQILAACGK